VLTRWQIVVRVGWGLNIIGRKETFNIRQLKKAFDTPIASARQSDFFLANGSVILRSASMQLNYT
jgi:hypothetical protein